MTDAIKQKLDQLADLRQAHVVFDLQKQDLISSVLTPEIRARLEEIDAEFAEKTAFIVEQEAALEAEIKTLVLENGATVKGQYLQAVYTKPRTTWDNKMLDGMMAIIPQLREARKEGAPSVSFRSLDK